MGAPPPHSLPSPSRWAWELSVVATGFQEQQEGKPRCNSDFHVSACFTFAAILLAKGSHVAKFKVIVGGLYRRGFVQEGELLPFLQTMTVSLLGKLLPWLLTSGKSRKGVFLPYFQFPHSWTCGEFVPWRTHQPAFQRGRYSAPLKPGSRWYSFKSPNPCCPAWPDLARATWAAGPCDREFVPFEYQTLPKPYAVWEKALFTVNVTAENWQRQLLGLEPVTVGKSTETCCTHRPQEAEAAGLMKALLVLLRSLGPTSLGH